MAILSPNYVINGEDLLDSILNRPSEDIAQFIEEGGFRNAVTVADLDNAHIGYFQAEDTATNRPANFFEFWYGETIEKDGSNEKVQIAVGVAAGGTHVKQFVRGYHAINGWTAWSSLAHTDQDTTFEQNVTIEGDLTVNGTTSTINVEDINVTDNKITVNDGETGAGVSAGDAGIIVDRGTATNYEFIFDEATDTFRVGEVGSLQPVATREDSPAANGFAVWNSGSSRFDTRVIATQGEAEGGTNNTAPMTPLRVHQAFQQYGLKNRPLLSSTNADTLTSINAFYLCDLTVTNLPGAGEWWLDVYASTDTANAYQLATDTTTNETYFRTYTGTWSAWSKRFGTNNIASQAEAEAGTINDKPMTPLRVHQAFKFYGLGGRGSTAETDLDLYPIGSIGIVSPSTGLTNAPTGFVLRLVVTTLGHQDGLYVEQWATDINGRKAYRAGNGSPTVWGTWRELFHTGNIASQAESEAGTVNDKPMTPLRVHQAFNKFGLGKNERTATNNLDTELVMGIYGFDSGATGNPTTLSGSLIVFPRSSTSTAVRYLQMIIVQDGTIYRRTNINGVWQSWTKDFHEGNVASQAESEAGTVNDKPMTPLRVHQAFNKFGLGIFGDGSSDFNATLSQFIHGSNNSPSGFQSGLAMMAASNQGWVISQRSGKVYFKEKESDVWQSWKELFHTGNIASQAEAEVGTVNDKPMTPLRTYQAFSRYGIGRTSASDESDLNSVVATGAYRFGVGTVNRPTQFDYGSVWVHKRSSSEETQVALNTSTPPKMAYRQKVSGVWGSWNEVYQSGNNASQAEAEAGTIDNKPMTPLRTKNAIDAQALRQSQNLGDVASASTSFNNIKQAATESATGVVELPTQAEAEAGTDNTRAMTPLRTYQQNTARIASQAEAEATTDDVKLMTSLKTWRSYSQYGLGSTQVANFPNNDVDDFTTGSVRTGFYRTVNATHTGLPNDLNPLDTGILYHVMAFSNVIQEWHQESTNTKWFRTHDGSSWTTWQLISEYSEIIQLAGDFDSTNDEIKVTRIGDTVTITATQALTTTSATSLASSSTGVLPAFFRPSGPMTNVYHVEGGSPSSVRMITVQATGDIELYINDFNNGNPTVTAWNRPTITYNI